MAWMGRNADIKDDDSVNLYLSGVYAANGGDMKPTLDMLDQLEVVLIYDDVETGDLDVRDRAYIYWQLLLTVVLIYGAVETDDLDVTAISVISISSDSLDESVGSSLSQIILFSTIPAEIPAETPTIPSVVPTLPHTSPFLYTDSSDCDTFERPPSHDPYEVTVARWRSRVAARSSPPSLPTHDSPHTLH
ncbi:hypothetical protein Tco_0079060 [Tanacetum coccineum]